MTAAATVVFRKLSLITLILEQQKQQQQQFYQPKKYACSK